VKVGLRIQGETVAGQLVLVDCITLLVNNVIGEFLSPDGKDIDEPSSEEAATKEIEGLVRCIKASVGDFILVTNEVGLGLVPDNKLGRVYRDLLGKANQVLAGAADEVYFMVSGLPLRVKP
jgi:adenosylcobinamide kinase/adenosylcobinamide-phosphate guanylyltransferase